MPNAAKPAGEQPTMPFELLDWQRELLVWSVSMMPNRDLT